MDIMKVTELNHVFALVDNDKKEITLLDNLKGVELLENQIIIGCSTFDSYLEYKVNDFIHPFINDGEHYMAYYGEMMDLGEYVGIKNSAKKHNEAIDKINSLSRIENALKELNLNTVVEDIKKEIIDNMKVIAEIWSSHTGITEDRTICGYCFGMLEENIDRF